MNTRRLASVALAAVVVLSTAGCSMISPQATTITYSPAEGVNIAHSEPLKVRNALFVANEDGTEANFLAAIVNDTDSAESLLVGVDGTTQRVRVPARSTVSLGFDGTDPLLFTGLSSKPGTDVKVSFQSGTGEAVEDRVPVLDGTLSYLADFVPAS
ncbi:DNA modification methylase [Microbacterium hominis]|uniref:DNA modification methylase n=1 Tax=Microbacterium hominis TaxID=162426 RepID=UPI001966BA08|nr:DNA modification methylase [Microbacterium hominis]QRY40442.1 DNA modification methylase [Microbacterium hominis]